jgi:hypothetical protein
MPLPTSGEIKIVAEIGEAALREVAPCIATKLTEELTSIYGKERFNRPGFQGTRKACAGH